MKVKSSAATLISASVFLTTAALAVALTGCGVRGRPQPPLKPAELGRGEPSFKRATEEFAFPVVPSPTPVSDPKSNQEGH